MDQTSDNIYLMLLLICIAMAAAWYGGYRSRFKFFPGIPKKISPDYFVGLNYLLNDEPDDAIDIFIEALEINSTTLDTHIALGTLLRRRGKVDRSISLYQSLLAKNELSQDEHDLIKVNLVRSYVAAGLLDRAERLLDELRTASTEIRQQALEQAVTVYQLEKDWDKAIAACTDLQKMLPAGRRGEFQLRASHYYCELCDEEFQQKHFNAARDYVKKAQHLSRVNVRANLLLGHIEMEAGNYKEAMKALEKVVHQDPVFGSEAITAMLICMQKGHMNKQLQKYKENSVQAAKSTTEILELTDMIEGNDGQESALAFIIDKLSEKPSLHVVLKGMELLANTSSQPTNEKLEQLHRILKNYLDNQASYQCRNCGFELKSLHWMCPGCNKWGTVKPIEGILGE